MNVPRVKSVKPVTEKRLLVTFVNGIQKVYDCNGIMHLDRFRSLQRTKLFSRRSRLILGDTGYLGTMKWI